MGTPARAIRVRFGEVIWRSQVLKPFSKEVAELAHRARETLEQEGVLGSAIDRHYDPVGPKGTRLPRCVKLYVPLGADSPTDATFGMVLQLQSDGSLAFIAFGRRHPEPPERDVDERAHRALHGRFPDQAGVPPSD